MKLFPIMIITDRCKRSYNNLDDPFSRITVSNKAESINEIFQYDSKNK